MMNMSGLNYSREAARLLDLGMPDTPWPDYPARFQLSSEHIPELIQMAADENSWEEDSESPTVYRNVHAWRALAQLHAVEAIPALVTLLRWVDEYHDDWTGEDLPEALAIIGPAAIPALADYLADSNHGMWARVAAATSLEEVGKRHPEARSESAAAIAHTLQNYEKNSPLLNGEMITALSGLRQPETYALVEQAYQAGKVDQSIMGDWEDFQVEVGLLAERLTEQPDYQFGLRSLMEEALNPQQKQAGRKTDKKDKAKRKMEKQSRKKNRKKK